MGHPGHEERKLSLVFSASVLWMCPAVDAVLNRLHHLSSPGQLYSRTLPALAPECGCEVLQGLQYCLCSFHGDPSSGVQEECTMSPLFLFTYLYRSIQQDNGSYRLFRALCAVGSPGYCSPSLPGLFSLF